MAGALGQQLGGGVAAVAGPLQLLQLGAEGSAIPGQGLWRQGACQHQGAFPLGRRAAEVFDGCAHAGAHLLFVLFGEFAGDAQGPITQHRQQIVEQIEQPVRSFKQHHGALLSLQFLQSLTALVGLGRQEALKAEAAARQAAAHQRGGDGAGAGDADHVVPSCAGGRHQHLARIGDARQPGVTDHG